MVIRFFHHRHNGQWPPNSKDVYTRYYPLHYFPILILEKELVFSLLNVAKQGHYLWRLWYDAVLDWGWNPGLPALEASTLPLGYRGGGVDTQWSKLFQVLDCVYICIQSDGSKKTFLRKSTFEKFSRICSTNQWLYPYSFKQQQSGFSKSPTQWAPLISWYIYIYIYIYITGM